MKVVGVSMTGVESEPGFQKAGISRYAINVVGEMARRQPGTGFEVYVNERFSRPAEWSELRNVRLHTVRRYRTYRSAAGILSLLQSFSAWFLPAYDPLRMSPVPQVAMIHDLFPISHPEWFEDPQRAPMRSAIQRTVRLSDVLLTNSEATKSELLRLFPRLRKPIGVTPLGIGNLGEPCDPGTVSREELKNLGVPFERFALCLGTVEPRKNLARLLEAWPLAAQKLPDTGLVVVGAKGWGGAIPSLPGRVAYLGYLDDKQLPMLFARCEFLICASLDEGFGLPVLEALHFGAPVVLSNRGALQEVAGELAVYFDPYSVEAIAAALISGFQRGADKVSLVARGMSRARLFSWEAAADSTIGWMDRAGRGGREADPG